LGLNSRRRRGLRLPLQELKIFLVSGFSTMVWSGGDVFWSREGPKGRAFLLLFSMSWTEHWQAREEA